MSITRRQFAGSAAAFSALTAFVCDGAAGGGGTPPLPGVTDAAVGKPLAAWQPGHFQIHAIYTGVGESIFLIYPDGTSMLVDCGECGTHREFPALPSRQRFGGEWTARYVLRMNPHGKKVDRFLLTHYHNDHAGCKRREYKLSKDGSYHVSGIGEAIEFLDFGTVIDRAWPTFDDPYPVPPSDDESTLANLKGVYAEMQRRGTKIERFRLEQGSKQLDPLHGKVKDFSVTPVCANGRILQRDGKVRDLFVALKAAKKMPIRENPQSLGFIIQYGKFRYFAAGDFCEPAGILQPDGTKRNIEDLLAEQLDPVTVAKANHHALSTMTNAIVKALRAQVFFVHSWHLFQSHPASLAHMADRSLYPADRLICPVLFPPSHQVRDKAKPWIKDIPKAVYTPKHLVFDVPPGGETFRLAFVRAADESMTVESVLDFQTRSCE